MICKEYNKGVIGWGICDTQEKQSINFLKILKM